MADFNPDEFLAKTAPKAKEEPAFDPDAFLGGKKAETASAPVPEEKGFLERIADKLSSAPEAVRNAGRGAAQGFSLGWGDEAGGVISGIQDALNSSGSNRSILERFKHGYDQGRLEERLANEKAKAANPKLYGTAKGLAAIPAAVASGGAGGLAGGAALGGATAWGNSTGDSSEQGKNSAEGSLLGAAAAIHPLVGAGLGLAGVAMAPTEADRSEAIASLLGGTALGVGARRFGNQQAVASASRAEAIQEAAQPHLDKIAINQERLATNLKNQQLAVPDKKQALIDRLTDRVGRQEDKLSQAEEATRLELPRKRQPEELSKLLQKNSDAQADNDLAMKLRAKNASDKLQLASANQKASADYQSARDAAKASTFSANQKALTDYQSARDAAKSANANADASDQSALDAFHQRLKQAQGEHIFKQKVQKYSNKQLSNAEKAATSAESRAADAKNSLEGLRRQAYQHVENRAGNAERLAGKGFEDIPELSDQAKQDIRDVRSSYINNSDEAIREGSPRAVVAKGESEVARTAEEAAAARKTFENLRSKGVDPDEATNAVLAEEARLKSVRELPADQKQAIMDELGVRDNNGTYELKNPAQRVALPARPQKQQPTLPTRPQKQLAGPSADVGGEVRRQQLLREQERLTKGIREQGTLTPEQQKQRLADGLAAFKAQQGLTSGGAPETDPWLNTKLRAEDRAKTKLEATRGQLSDDAALTAKAEQLTAKLRNSQQGNENILRKNIDILQRKASPETIIKKGEKQLPPDESVVGNIIKGVLVPGSRTVRAVKSVADAFRANPDMAKPEVRAAYYDRALKRIGNAPEKYGNAGKAVLSMLAGKNAAVGLPILMKLAEKNPQVASALEE